MMKWLVGFIHGAVTVAAWFLAYLVDHLFLLVAFIGSAILVVAFVTMIIENWDD